MTNEFFAERKRWSQDKYAVLGRYLETASRILKYVWAVDLFAGPGRFESGEDGSPLIITRLAARAEEESRSYVIRGIFVERDKKLYQNLEICLSQFPSHLYTTYQGSFTKHLGTILAKTEGFPALFFLDPFGMKGLNWQIFAPVFERADKTELLINFNVVHSRRLAGFLTSSSKHRDAWLSVLDKAMGDQEWRQAVIPESANDPRDRAICQEYLQRLIHKAGFKFAASYPVSDPTNGSLKYFLIYATRHMKGADRMNDVMYKSFEETRDRAADYAISRGIQLSLLNTPPSSEEIKVTKIRSLVKDLVDVANQTKKPLTFEQLRYELIGKWFGQANTSLVREAVKQCIRDGKIDRNTETGIADKEILRFRT